MPAHEIQPCVLHPKSDPVVETVETVQQSVQGSPPNAYCNPHMTLPRPLQPVSNILNLFISQHISISIKGPFCKDEIIIIKCCVLCVSVVQWWLRQFRPMGCNPSVRLGSWACMSYRELHRYVCMFFRGAHHFHFWFFLTFCILLFRLYHTIVFLSVCKSMIAFPQISLIIVLCDHLFYV